MEAASVMTITQALNTGREQLKESETAGLEARLLLSHVMGVSQTTLLAYGERPLTPEQQQQYLLLVERLAHYEPLHYLVGYAHFYDLTFKVSPAVLIPRSETELLVEMAIDYARTLSNPVVADIGTGCGAIAVTVAKHVPNAQMHAVEISPEALAVARENAHTLGVEIRFYEGSLTQPLVDAGVKVDILLANLPYIPADVVPTLVAAEHEPTVAFDGGSDGLDLIRKLVEQIPHVCKPGALILLEIGSTQGQATLEIARAGLPLQSSEMLLDYAGLERNIRLQLA